MRRLSKFRRKECAEKPEFVPEEAQAKLLDIFWRHPTLCSLDWVKRPKSARRSLDTPFGVLEVRLELGWEAFRDDKPLVHSACRSVRRSWYQPGRWPACFTDENAARAAALMHCIDGWITDWNVLFTFVEPINTEFTGLFWWLPRAAGSKDALVATATDAWQDVVATDLEDNYEFPDHNKLRGLVHPWGGLATPDLLKSCEDIRSRWRLPLPPFKRRTQGWYKSPSPYGNLVIRRHGGWVIEKKSAALCYLSGGAKVVCDKLQDALTLALIFAPICGDGRLYWRQPETAALEPALAGQVAEQGV